MLIFVGLIYFQEAYSKFSARCGWRARLQTMPTLERYALLSAMQEVWPPALSPEKAIPADTVISDEAVLHRRK